MVLSVKYTRRIYSDSKINCNYNGGRLSIIRNEVITETYQFCLKAQTAEISTVYKSYNFKEREFCRRYFHDICTNHNHSRTNKNCAKMLHVAN